MLNTVGVGSLAGKGYKNQTVGWRFVTDRTFILVSTVAFILSLTSAVDLRSLTLLHINKYQLEEEG